MVISRRELIVGVSVGVGTAGFPSPVRAADDLRSIAYGQTRTGTIDGDDPEDEYYEPSDRTKAEPVTFYGSSGDDVEIEMRADSFDPFLRLESPSGDTADENDDDSPSSTTSRIRRTLRENGEYTIWAQSATGGRGEYRLRLRLAGGTSTPSPMETPTSVPTTSPTSDPSTTPVGTPIGAPTDDSGTRSTRTPTDPPMPEGTSTRTVVGPATESTSPSRTGTSGTSWSPSPGTLSPSRTATQPPNPTATSSSTETSPPVTNPPTKTPCGWVTCVLQREAVFGGMIGTVLIAVLGVLLAIFKQAEAKSRSEEAKREDRG